VRGERSRYEPIAKFSRIVSTSEPIAILEQLFPSEVYVADLNLLTGQGDNLELIRLISGRTRTMADLAVSEAAHLDRMPPDICPVLGTETAAFSIIEQAAAERRIVVSIDMIRGRLLSRDITLASDDPLHLLRRLNSLNLEGIILLELDRVGTSSGLNSSFLENAAKASEHPLILGGGVKDEEDLSALENMGYSGALVATALHSGAIPLARIREPGLRE